MAKKSLIVGGAGALGRGIINVFKNKGWQVMSMDFKSHEKADSNLILDSSQKI